MDDVLSTLRIKILHAQASQLDELWKSDLDNSPFSKLYYIESGSGYLRHHDNEFKLEPGHVYLIPPLSGLSYGCDSQIEIWWLHFTADVLMSLDLFDYINCSYEIAPKNISHIRIGMSNLIALFSKGGVDSQLLANGILMQLLASFVKEKGYQVNSERRELILRFQPAMDYVEKHLGEKLSVTELAKKVSLERAYFSTLFSKTFNISPALYINRKRIERAQKLLCETDLKLEAVSQELGFTDAFHLSKTFKKFTGLSPSEFRKKKAHLIP